MNRRASCLQIEELEQRTVPTLFFVGGRLVGCHPIHETINTGLNSTTSASGNIPNGLLRGKVALGNVVTSRSFLKENFGGTITITTTMGTLTIQSSGSVNILSGSTNGSGQVTHGTGAFQGATGSVALQGTTDLLGKTLHGTLTGMICGRGAHHVQGARS
jgi:hypothetical protein